MGQAERQFRADEHGAYQWYLIKKSQLRHHVSESRQPDRGSLYSPCRLPIPLCRRLPALQEAAIQACQAYPREQLGGIHQANA